MADCTGLVSSFSMHSNYFHAIGYFTRNVPAYPLIFGTYDICKKKNPIFRVAVLEYRPGLAFVIKFSSAFSFIVLKVILSIGIKMRKLLHKTVYRVINRLFNGQSNAPADLE